MFIVDNLLQDLSGALTKGWIYEMACVLSELIQAETEKLIDSSWRRGVDVKQIQLMLVNEKDHVVANLTYDIEQLRRILSSGVGLQFEEALLVLFLRSDVQLASQICDTDVSEELRRIDECLRHVVEKYRDVFLQCHNRDVRFYRYLSDHWWWR